METEPEEEQQECGSTRSSRAEVHSVTKLLTEGRSETLAKANSLQVKGQYLKTVSIAGADTATDFGKGKLVQALILAGSLR